jgi:hypothetical protein
MWAKENRMSDSHWYMNNQRLSSLHVTDRIRLFNEMWGDVQFILHQTGSIPIVHTITATPMIPEVGDDATDGEDS